MTSDQSNLEHNDSYLTHEERDRLLAAPKLSDFHRQKLDKESKKNWDLFYKRNGDRFFKNRYWTRNEFNELFSSNSDGTVKYLLEVGCGCGDFVLPFLEAADTEDNCDKGLRPEGLYIYCCDISDQAIKILTKNETFQKNCPSKIKAFVADLTDDKVDFSKELDGRQMDLVSLVFVLSAVDPQNMAKFVENISKKIIKPGGLVLFRDYAIYDKAMLRFNEQSKICDQFYVRQDGTRAYFFAKEQLSKLFEASDFKTESIEYVRRETTNKATSEKFSRVFLQAKFRRH